MSAREFATAPAGAPTGGRFENRLREERVAASIASPEALADLAGLDRAWYARIEAGELLPDPHEIDRLTAALGGIPRTRLYSDGYADCIGVTSPPPKVRDFANSFTSSTETAHLFVTPGEIGWLEQQSAPVRPVDVVVNMSCSTQLVPNLLLDTVAVLRALDVNFVALAGRAACCGKPYRNAAQHEASDRMNLTALTRSRAWGATTHVNWCSSCQITYAASSARRAASDSDAPVLREVQLLSFLAERLDALHTRVPWKQEVDARVLVIGGDNSEVHATQQATVMRLLGAVPGAEVVGVLGASDPALPDGPRMSSPQPTTAEAVARIREQTAALIAARGADTVSAQHQYGHKQWSYYASERLAVRHCVSIIAEALGVGSADRFQAAVRLGSAQRVVDHARAIWDAWGMTEPRALQLASELFDPIYMSEAGACGCGGAGSCANDLISLD